MNRFIVADMGFMKSRLISIGPSVDLEGQVLIEVSLSVEGFSCTYVSIDQISFY